MSLINSVNEDIAVGSIDICFIIRSWDYGKDIESYLNKIFYLAKHYVEQSKTVEFVLFSKDKISNLCSLSELGMIRHWSPSDEEMSSFVYRLKRYKIIVSSRFHGIVFALGLGIPVVGINVDPKIENLFSMLGQEDKLWNYPFNEYDAVTMIDSIFTSSFIYDKSLIARQTELADASLEIFENYLKSMYD